MPTLTIEGVGEFEVPLNKRLVNAIVDEGRVEQWHSCGGNARCTTCRVQFVAGEPPQMTEAEKQVLAARGLIDQNGLRLSCQIVCSHNMTIQTISLWREQGGKSAGARPTDEIAPPPVWTRK